MRNIDFNKYQSALIIGNGFDLSLGLSTSYMDFVNSDEFQILLNMQNQLAIYLKVNAELQSTNAYSPISVTPSGSWMFVSWRQLMNAYFPIFVTFFGS